VLQRAKDAVELLGRRAVLVINVEDFPELGFLDHFEWDPARGMACETRVPQFVCLVRGDDGAWQLAYRAPVPSPEWLHENRRFLEAKAHWLKVTAGKVCYETRGRRKEGEGEAGEAARRSRRRRGG
jgi:hypothetical protein